jgi:hypothetical protein
LKFLQNILRYIIIPEFFENFKSIINRCFRSGGKTWITLYVNVVVFYFEKYFFSDTLETENCLKFPSFNCFCGISFMRCYFIESWSADLLQCISEIPFVKKIIEIMKQTWWLSSKHISITKWQIFASSQTYNGCRQKDKALYLKYVYLMPVVDS